MAALPPGAQASHRQVQPYYLGLGHGLAVDVDTFLYCWVGGVCFNNNRVSATSVAITVSDRTGLMVAATYRVRSGTETPWRWASQGGSFCGSTTVYSPYPIISVDVYPSPNPTFCGVAGSGPATTGSVSVIWGGPPEVLSETTRRAPFDQGEVCVQTPTGPNCYRDSYANQEAPAKAAVLGQLTAGGWDYSYVPPVLDRHLASVSRSAVIARYRSIYDWDIKVTARVVGAEAAIAKGARLCLTLTNSTGTIIGTDCEVSGMDLSVSSPVTDGDVLTTVVSLEGGVDPAVTSAQVVEINYTYPCAPPPSIGVCPQD